MVSAGCGHNSGQVTHADTRMQRAVFSTLRPECIKYGYILTDNYISKMFLFFQIRWINILYLKKSYYWPWDVLCRIGHN